MTTAVQPIRILLIDDHVVMRMGLRMLLESQPEFTVVGEATNRSEALAIAAREQPDIVLLDLDLDGSSGLDLLPELQEVAGKARVILLTGVPASDEYVRAARMGVMGVVRKEQAAQVLMRAIEKVHAGETWLDRALVARVLSSLAETRPGTQKETNPDAARIARLTPRERQVVALICDGLYNQAIAARLSISEATVSHHLTSIYAKLGLANRFDLVVYAHRHGLTRRPS
jgi:DNA-binding NarL/FixJ family response regulator